MTYDTGREADIRGININKLATGFADEAIVMKNYVRTSTTDKRELRYWVKTAGFLDSTDTTGITASQIYNTSFGSLPVVVEQSWERTTAHVAKFFVESPTFTIEDLKDNDVDMWATNVRDLVRAVSNQVDRKIYEIVADKGSASGDPADGSSVPSAAGVADGWDDEVTGNPVLDILTALESIRTYRYDTSNVTMLLHPGDYTSLVNWLINVKGSSIPGFASEKVRNGKVMSLLGVDIVVNTSFTEDFAVLFTKDTAVWKSFMPLTTAVVDDAGIGKKIRVWEEGEGMLTDPLAVHILTGVS